MARKLFDIVDAIIAEKNNQAVLNGLQPSIDSAQTILNDLNGPSRVSDWRLWCWIVGVAIWTQEKLWDAFKIELDTKINNAPFGTTRWYQQQALLFQYGDTLVWLDDKYKYSVIDAAKQIIARSAVVENAGQVVIKVAKVVSGVVTKLSAIEKAAFEQYILKIKGAGTQTIIISDDPDDLKIAVTAYYDPLVLAADGSLLTDAAVFPLEDAINNHISELDFNGDLVLTKLTDSMQAATGIANPIITLAQAKFGAGSYSAINVKYNAHAGHMVIDGSFPLNTQITYIANV